MMYVVFHKPSKQYVGWCWQGYFLGQSIDSAKLFSMKPIPRQDAGMLHRTNWVVEVREMMTVKREDYEVKRITFKEVSTEPLFKDWVSHHASAHTSMH